MANFPLQLQRDIRMFSFINQILCSRDVLVQSVQISYSYYMTLAIRESKS